MIRFLIPKVYSWEDVKREILENMEREGIPLDGIGAGSTELSTIMYSPEKRGVVGTSTDGLLADDKAPEEANSAVFVFGGKRGQPYKITIGGSSSADIR